MPEQLDHLHFLLIPFLSQGHIIPLIDFAKLLAGHGVVVSIITTPRNCTRYKKTIHHTVEAGLKLQLVPLDFPNGGPGLHQGSEEMDAINSLDSARGFFKACETLEAPLQTLMAEMHPKPSCIVSSNALPWTQRVAETFNIPRYIFETISCFALLSCHMHEEAAADAQPYYTIESPRTKSKPVGENSESTIQQIKRARDRSRATLVNSFDELEGVYVGGYRHVARRLWCVGPVSLCNKNSTEKSDRGNKASIDEHYYISWLDKKEKRSVIYACFGSLCRIPVEQIKEIGLGLEASGFPFIWIIRGADSSAEVDKWLEEEKFEERVEGRGLIIRGWAPQVLILSHPSVGGFLTHCGWNSILEGVSAGVPFITWPMFSEQFFNEKFIVEVVKVGVRVGVEAEAKKAALVKWDRVKKAVENLMEEDDEGGERRRRATELAEMASETLEEGGSSYMNIKLFIQDVVSCADNGYLATLW